MEKQSDENCGGKLGFHLLGLPELHEFVDIDVGFGDGSVLPPLSGVSCRDGAGDDGPAPGELAWHDVPGASEPSPLCAMLKIFG